MVKGLIVQTASGSQSIQPPQPYWLSPRFGPILEVIAGVVPMKTFLILSNPDITEKGIGGYWWVIIIVVIILAIVLIVIYFM